ncbi:hypothetical protein QG37_02363 [Candidozyma auris]|uniref:Uncharacterized protein n=1 Tax=Candidozyma auris TaxID=498019 RepID=A0A0L0P236_CANAR|nr:hypothetical protein QG37_02363 [[Candida] auris]
MICFSLIEKKKNDEERKKKRATSRGNPPLYIAAWGEFFNRQI